MSAVATAVVFDLGGVITESPMRAFTAYEAEAGLPVAQAVDEVGLVLHHPLDAEQRERAAREAQSMVDAAPRVREFVPSLVARALALRVGR